jgi:hypothetical protein
MFFLKQFEVEIEVEVGVGVACFTWITLRYITVAFARK